MGNNIKNISQAEKELIYLMLHHKEAIEQIHNGGIVHTYFSDDLRPIVLSIFES